MSLTYATVEQAFSVMPLRVGSKVRSLNPLDPHGEYQSGATKFMGVTMEIQPQLLTFNSLVKDRLFRIPQYQRAYSWTTKQRRDLFEDIEKLTDRPDKSHFMATVVGLRRETRKIMTDVFQVIEIVDGQQRLTTLILLYKAIESVLDVSDLIQASIHSELDSLLVKKDQLAPVLLQTNHDSSQLCSTYLREGKHPSSSTATTLSDRRLLEAIEECEKFVAAWTVSGKDLSLLFTLVKNQLVFIMHEISDESLVYTVFEVLNSRGLDVSWFDRLKTALMGIAFESESGDAKETIDELHTLWREIYQCIGLRQGMSTESLRFAATLCADNQPSRPLGEEDSVDVLRAAASKSPKGVIDMSNWILRVTRAVDELYSDKRRDAVTEIVQARLLAVAILVRDDLSDENRKSLLNAWESVSFRIFGLFRKDARTKVGDYVRLAWISVVDRLDCAALLLEIRHLGDDHPVDGGVTLLRDSDCYTDWQTRLRYLLFRFEETLARERGQKFNNEQWNRIWSDTAARSIEHICPQSKGSASRTPTGIFVHRLGNLLLLPPGLNSKLGAKDPVDKKVDYVNTGLAIAGDVAERIPPWDRAAVEKREEELIAWASKEWA